MRWVQASGRPRVSTSVNGDRWSSSWWGLGSASTQHRASSPNRARVSSRSPAMNRWLFEFHVNPYLLILCLLADDEVTITTVCVNFQLPVLQSDGEVTVTAVYRFRNSERLLMNRVGKWSVHAGLKLAPAFWDGPADLQGNLLHMAAVMVRLYVYLCSHSNMYTAHC